MVSWRLASSMSSRASIKSGFLSRQPSKDRADGQAKARQVALGQNIAGHDLSRGINVGKGTAACFDHARGVIDLDAHVGKRNSRTQWKSIIRRSIERQGPIAFRRMKAIRLRSVKRSGTKVRIPGGRLIVARDSLAQCCRIEFEARGQTFDGGGLRWPVNGRQKTANRFRVNDAISDLPRLFSD